MNVTTAQAFHGLKELYPDLWAATAPICRPEAAPNKNFVSEVSAIARCTAATCAMGMHYALRVTMVRARLEAAEQDNQPHQPAAALTQREWCLQERLPCAIGMTLIYC